jgi:NADP-dependent 3-hydroxy acid dehydrogenase YdfG
LRPGTVKTDFSLRRFAEVIGFVASRPSHVDLDLILIRPRDQVSGASGSRLNRS